MQIIKQGIKPEDRDCDGNCLKCGTIIRFKAGEGEFMNDQRDGSYYKIECPVCRAPIYGVPVQRGNGQRD